VGISRSRGRNLWFSDLLQKDLPECLGS
jgi:hypothetical protein